jgi:hypothetical protein
VLSLARSVKLWWHGRLELTAPPPPPARGELALPELGCSVTPPPRFVLGQTARHPFGPAAYFWRTSFSSLDAIDKLQIARFDAPVAGVAQLHELARADAREFTQGLDGVTYTADVGRPSLPSIVAVAEGTRPDYPRSRLVWEWSLGWKVLIYTTTAIPVDELRQTVQAVRDSLRG